MREHDGLKGNVRYVLTLTGAQAKTVNYAVELLIRWKLKQDSILAQMLLQDSIVDQGYRKRVDAVCRLMGSAMEYAIGDKTPLKDEEWFRLYNVHQVIRKAIHDVEHPQSRGVDSYPPMPTGMEELPGMKIVHIEGEKK